MMKKIDQHFHTTMSDWALTNEQVIDLAVQKWLYFSSVTEHDIVNTVFSTMAREVWIQSLEWVEISAFDTEIANKSLHITCYAQEFNWELIDILSNTRNWKIWKIIMQIDILNKNWFNINYADFITYFEKKWFDIRNLNNSHIAEYIYSIPANIELVKRLSWVEMTYWDFIVRCLKTTWDFRDIWWTKVDKYEPTVYDVWRIAKENWYFLSLAHPNFTFKDDIKLFLDFIEEYRNVLNWIEINALASKIWVEVILITAKKYNMILTFWSDDHFVRDKKDEIHWILWEQNTYVSEWDIMENFKIFMLVINAARSIKKS